MGEKREYPNGYQEKIAYWEDQADAAKVEADFVRAMNKLKHFRGKQEKWLSRDNITFGDDNIEELGSVFKASGAVLGDMWGGGSGIYDTNKYEATNLQALTELVEEALAENTLDAGFGFEALRGAFMGVTEVKSIRWKGQIWTTEVYSDITVGNISEEDIYSLETEYFTIR